MKQTVKITEEKIADIINEVIDELSPEFLAHASRMANNKGRTIQGKKFMKGAKSAFDRDYGFESDKDPMGSYNMVLDGDNYYTGASFKSKDNPSEWSTYWGHDMNADPNARWAADNSRAGIRNKVNNGEKAVDRMRNGMNPNGERYPDEPSMPSDSVVNEAVKRVINRYLDKL